MTRKEPSPHATQTSEQYTGLRAHQNLQARLAHRSASACIVPSALPLLDELEVPLLRLLGRLEMMTLPQIQHGVYPTYSVRGVQQRLEYLLADDLLWRVQTRMVAANHAASYTRVRKQGAYAYGLSDQGKELLNTLDVERDPLTFARLVSRDPKGRKPDLRTLSHDLQVSWWCLNVILAAAQNRGCRKIYVQTEFYPEKSQRIDALVILRLSPDSPAPGRRRCWVAPVLRRQRPQAPGISMSAWRLRWIKAPRSSRCCWRRPRNTATCIRWASTPPRSAGQLLPVFLVQTPRRAAQIATEFQDIWPAGWGVVGTRSASTAARACCGVSIRASRRRSRSSCSPIWSWTRSGRVQCFPAISREAWRDGVMIRHRALTPCTRR